MSNHLVKLKQSDKIVQKIFGTWVLYNTKEQLHEQFALAESENWVHDIYDAIVDGKFKKRSN